MKVRPGNAQHIGDRRNQEDAFGFSNFGDPDFERHGGVMMVLCDGMGGLPNGADASRIAVEAILSGYRRKQPSEDIASALDRVIQEAQRAVCSISGHGETAGTTVVVAVVWKNRLFCASVGDSRLYLCRGRSSAIQLTEDDNVASLLDQRVERGETTQIAAASAPNREALTGYLGSPDPPQPDIRKDGLLLQPGDRVIGCSDGLYRGLSSKAMAEASYHKDPMSAAEQLVDTVLRQRLPHQDNLTVVLFELSPYFRFAWFFRVVSELFSLTGLGRAPGPVMSGGLWGAVGGFAAAMAFAALLHWFGVWDFSSAEQDAVGDVPLDQTSPVNPVKSPTPQDEPPSFPEPVPKPTPPEEGRQDQPSESGIEEQDAPARAKAEGTP